MVHFSYIIKENFAIKREDELFNMCKKLDKASRKAKKNKIALARDEVVKYIENDRDKYLQLKAEVESIPETIESKNYIYSTLGFVIASLALLISAVSLCVKSDKALFALIILFFFIMLLLYTLYMSKCFSVMTMWKKYILAVIDEFKMEDMSEKKDE